MEPTYSYGQRVRIMSGFYKDVVGVVVDEYGDKFIVEFPTVRAVPTCTHISRAFPQTMLTKED